MNPGSTVSRPINHDIAPPTAHAATTTPGVSPGPATTEIQTEIAEQHSHQASRPVAAPGRPVAQAPYRWPSCTSSIGIATSRTTSVDLSTPMIRPTVPVAAAAGAASTSSLFLAPVQARFDDR